VKNKNIFAVCNTFNMYPTNDADRISGFVKMPPNSIIINAKLNLRGKIFEVKNKINEANKKKRIIWEYLQKG
jgi:hypothetical protein